MRILRGCCHGQGRMADRETHASAPSPRRNKRIADPFSGRAAFGIDFLLVGVTHHRWAQRGMRGAEIVPSGYLEARPLKVNADSF